MIYIIVFVLAILIGILIMVMSISNKLNDIEDTFVRLVWALGNHKMGGNDD